MSDAGQGGFDAAQFAARMSSIGHAGNMGEGQSGGSDKKLGVLAGEIGVNPDFIASLESVKDSGLLNIFPPFRLSHSFIGATFPTNQIDVMSQYIGNLVPSNLAVINLPNPSQTFQSGKGQGQGAH
ncbi:MAG: hypothetical protein ACK4OM_04485 [Alphaproteobacteria bacterium]